MDANHYAWVGPINCTGQSEEWPPKPQHLRKGFIWVLWINTCRINVSFKTQEHNTIIYKQNLITKMTCLVLGCALF